MLINILKYTINTVEYLKWILFTELKLRCWHLNRTNQNKWYSKDSELSEKLRNLDIFHTFFQNKNTYGTFPWFPRFPGPVATLEKNYFVFMINKMNNHWVSRGWFTETDVKSFKSGALWTITNTGEPRRVFIPFVWYGHPNKFAQIIFLQHLFFNSIPKYSLVLALTNITRSMINWKNNSSPGIFQRFCS